MSEVRPKLSLSPVRIYVLWHPGLDDQPDKKDRGFKLARRLYHWFRMENMEGIPVYFRTTPNPKPDHNSKISPPGSKAPKEIEGDEGVRNYIIPLVDANMVACPHWRKYLAFYAGEDPVSKKQPDGPSTKYRFLPVALESVAYNLPESMRLLNFIRHMAGVDGNVPGDMRLIAKLTEVLCRDLRNWLDLEHGDAPKVSPNLVASKIKIFLSHAKADDTNEALALKDHIQKETQCEAFFDETDLASAYNFSNGLEHAIKHESAGLIVLQGDNYADRPWCRKEIRDFLEPVHDHIGKAEEPDLMPPAIGYRQYFIPPVLVVQTMKGSQIARTIAELGYSPCVRWMTDPDAARFVVTTLLREITFGLFSRVLARSIRQTSPPPKDPEHLEGFFINRAPDPVMINRILKALALEKPSPKIKPSSETESSLKCIHPGYGLSAMEAEGLKVAVNGVEFDTFLQHAADREEAPVPNLRDKIISISVGNAEDLLGHGYSDEHTRELLLRLLRPMLRAEASILYAGGLPKSVRPPKPWNFTLNFTATFLNLLLSERATSENGKDKEVKDKNGDEQRPARLYVPNAWDPEHSIHASDIAQWSDICTFVDVPSASAGFDSQKIPPTPAFPPPGIDLDLLSAADSRKRKVTHAKKVQAHERELLAFQARALSAMRRKICARVDGTGASAPLHFTFPDDPAPKTLSTFAHIIIGGKTQSFCGMMPGIFEEFLHAYESEKPIFLIGAYGGSAHLLAEWLCDLPPEKPEEMTPAYYAGRNAACKAVQEAVMEYPGEVEGKPIPYAKPEDALNGLWKIIQEAHRSKDLAKILRNGLDHQQNLKLLKTWTSGDICRSIWSGISNLVSAGG